MEERKVKNIKVDESSNQRGCAYSKTALERF